MLRKSTLFFNLNLLIYSFKQNLCYRQFLVNRRLLVAIAIYSYVKFSVREDFQTQQLFSFYLTDHVKLTELFYSLRFH